MQADARSGTATTLRAGVGVAVAAALERAIATGALPDATEARSAAIEVSRPAKPEHGDFAANIALRLARPLRMAPIAIASALAESLASIRADNPESPIASAEAVNPGFLNLRVTDAAIEAIVDRARSDPASWGRLDVAGAQPRRHVNVEFVSTRAAHSSATCCRACWRPAASV